MSFEKNISNHVRVVQLIDSLDAGGAERMAVNLSNTLADKVQFSGLVVTRNEGALKTSISAEVGYLFLGRKKIIDVKALKKLNSFIVKHKVNTIHAHASSFFMAFLVKLIKPKLRIIWHDHYGESENLESRPYKVIKLSSFVFSHIISVNLALRQWAKSKLKFKNVTYIRNFSSVSPSNQEKLTFLKGEEDEIKIVQIANLRRQKAHKIAFQAIKLLINQDYNISLHCIGAYSKEDPYFISLENFIQENDLSNNIRLYGSRNDISFILTQAKIGLLSSRSEGLPITLLEYAQSKLPVVVTDVGQCADVVGKHAQVVKPNDAQALAKAIAYYIENPDIASSEAETLYEKVQKEFNAKVIINQIINIYQKVLK